MAQGICDACAAMMRAPAAVSVADMKAAIRNGFKPRYGRASFDAAFMKAVGSSFGLSDVTPPAHLQTMEHEKAVEAFVEALKTKDDKSELSICEVCSEQVNAILAKARPLPDLGMKGCLYLLSATALFTAGLIYAMAFAVTSSLHHSPPTSTKWSYLAAAVLLCGIGAYLVIRLRKLNIRMIAEHAATRAGGQTSTSTVANQPREHG